jgi:hypothetical protein
VEQFVSLFMVSMVVAMVFLVVGGVFKMTGKINDQYQHFFMSAINRFSSIEMVKASLVSIRELLVKQVTPRNDKEREELNSYLKIFKDIFDKEDVTEMKAMLREVSLPDWISLYPKKPSCSLIGWIFHGLAFVTFTIPLWAFGVINFLK